jgi:hypothetical protein
VHTLEAWMSGLTVVGVFDGAPLLSEEINDNLDSTRHGILVDTYNVVLDNFKATNESFTNPLSLGYPC